MRIIPTRLHGVIDYLAGILFIILPKILDWNQTANYLLSIMGVSVIVYSLITRYELGAIKWMPMRVHLILDILSGLLLIAAPFIFPVAGDGVTGWLVGLGIFEILAGLMTDSAPRTLRAGTPDPVGVYEAHER
jgi:hypothetical protein